MGDCHSVCDHVVSGCNAFNYNPSVGECCFMKCEDPYKPIFASGGTAGYESWVATDPSMWTLLHNKSQPHLNCPQLSGDDYGLAGQCPTNLLGLSGCQQACSSSVLGCNAFEYNHNNNECCFKACEDPYNPSFAGTASIGYEVWIHRAPLAWTLVHNASQPHLDCPQLNGTDFDFAAQCPLYFDASDCQYVCENIVTGCNGINYNPSGGECCFHKCEDASDPIFASAEAESRNYQVWMYKPNPYPWN